MSAAEERLAEELAAGLAALCDERSLTLWQLAQKVSGRELARQLAAELLAAREEPSERAEEEQRRRELAERCRSEALAFSGQAAALAAAFEAAAGAGAAVEGTESWPPWLPSFDEAALELAGFEQAYRLTWRAEP